MRVDDFDYELPRELIAQAPADQRDQARLLYFDGQLGHHAATHHGTVQDLVELLREGDLLVLNNTRVRAARLFAYRETGARVEFLFLGPEAGHPNRWRALVNPARKLKVGEALAFELPEGSDEASAPTLRAIERLPHDAEPDKPGPTWIVEFEGALDPAQIEAFFEFAGHMPLPPYISRKQGVAGDTSESFDRERYQTVFNEKPGAVAAPTAGLHFTADLLRTLEEKGVRQTTVTLHVGLGTFAAVEVEDTKDHAMHSEYFELTECAVQAIKEARSKGGRIVCVGTTAVRVLESCAALDGTLRAGVGETRLFLTPGSLFHVCDVLLTNFHLPKSTLLMLVSAFIGRETALALYAEAIEKSYRFYSYGDAMLLVKRPQ
ncbi:MAG: tRNA preQ1(34) S-adenosylmethionine ribosyltransferase-isomerase QueA [Planctomycetota bacterium]|nr:tRNA preQ1(34) S-adenosylmethionine ribosyltransferase-isomerase QueA [Planctomycetota bacterium]